MKHNQTRLKCMRFIYKRRITTFPFFSALSPVCVDFASSDVTPVTVNKELKKKKKEEANLSGRMNHHVKHEKLILFSPMCLSVLSAGCVFPDDFHIAAFSTSFFFYQCQSPDTYSLPPRKNKLDPSTNVVILR